MTAAAKDVGLIVATPEQAANDNEARVEIPLEKFERLLKLLERVAQAQERCLAQDNDNARRAAKKAGPTTADAEAKVAARMKRWDK